MRSAHPSSAILLVRDKYWLHKILSQTNKAEASKVTHGSLGIPGVRGQGRTGDTQDMQTDRNKETEKQKGRHTETKTVTKPKDLSEFNSRTHTVEIENSCKLS